jgi:uncharacterized RDD family membrane protein YckC
VFSAGGDVARPTVPAGLTLAPMSRRVGGLLIDELVVLIPVLGVALTLGFSFSDKVSSHDLFAFSVAVTCVAFCYETLMVALLGRTVGKIAVGTRVVRFVDGDRPGWSEAVMRSLVPLALGAIPQVGLFLGALVYSLAFWNPLRQGLHDRAAGTLVVLNTTG